MSGPPGRSRWGAAPGGILSRTDQADTDISVLVGFAIEASPPYPKLVPIAPVCIDGHGLYNTDSSTLLDIKPEAEYKLITLKLTTATYAELLAKINSFNKAEDRGTLPEDQDFRNIEMPKIIVPWSANKGISEIPQSDDDGLRELLKMVVKRGFKDLLVVVYKWSPIVL